MSQQLSVTGVGGLLLPNSLAIKAPHQQGVPVFKSQGGAQLKEAVGYKLPVAAVCFHHGQQALILLDAKASRISRYLLKVCVVMP